MKNMKEWKNSISFKLSIRNALVLVTAFLILLFIICQINRNMVLKKEEQVFNAYLENTQAAVDDKLKDMGRVSLMSMADTRTQEVLLSWEEMDYEQRKEQEEYLQNFYASLVTIRKDIHGIFMTNEDSLIFYYDIENPTLTDENSQNEIATQLVGMEKEPLQLANCSLAISPHLEGMEYPGVYETDPYYKNCIWLIRDIYSFSPHTQVGSIALSIPIARIQEILENTLGEDMFYLLVSESGKIICSQDSSLLMSNIQDVNSDMTKMLGADGFEFARWSQQENLIMHKSSDESGLVLFVGKPAGVINQEITSFVKYYVVLCGAVLILILTMISVNVRKQFLPIKQLAGDMSQFDGQDLSKRYQVESQDESGQLMKSFNSMMDMLEDLIEKQYKDKMRIQEGKLKEQNLSMLYLKNQVNPHFLYNTLDTIRIRARMNGDQDVSAMLMKLVEFFRLSVKVDSTVVSLEHEMELLETYFELMCLRYPKLSWEQDIDPDLLDVEVPNFILQPLVENSILHGLRDKGYEGVVRITIHRLVGEDVIEIMIYDDGIGFTKEARKKVDNLLGETESQVSNSIGIRNIQNRLKLFYPKGCGLFYTEEKCGGVTAHIYIKEEITYEGMEVKM